MWEKIDNGSRVRCRYCFTERDKLESKKYLLTKKNRKYQAPEFPSNILGEDFNCNEIE
jgi:hypothetical protein